VAASSATRPYVRYDGSMLPLVLKAASTSTGCDAARCFTAATLEWNAMAAAGSATPAAAPMAGSLTTEVRAYAALDAIVFSQRYPNALHGTASGQPCGFIGGPAASLFNDCGISSASPRLSLGSDYRQWMSWAGGGNSPEPAFGSFDAMVGQAAFLKEPGVGGSTVARGLLTIAYEGRARAARTVQQELDSITLQPPWGRNAAANYSRAKAFCLGERRCRGFTWQVPSRGSTEPAPGELGRWRFVLS
jgi:hypothetical protein